MHRIKIILSILLLLFAAIVRGYAQQYAPFIGKELDLRPHGVGRTLCMKNGNTILFYLENQKRIVIKVFDSTRKEIAWTTDKSKLMNASIQAYMIEAIYDINNEAVLFVDQDIHGKHVLIRLRYNSYSAELIEEKVIAESRSEDKRMHFYIVKHKDDENYEILFCVDKHHPKRNDMFIVFFNNKHESLKEIQLLVDRKKYDDLKVVGVQSHPNGVLITVSLAKTEIYGLAGSNGPLNEKSSINNHFLQFFYIPMSSSTAQSSIVDLAPGVYPRRAHYDYNAFAQSLNVLLFSYKPIVSRFGLDMHIGDVRSNLFFKLDEQNIASAGVNQVMYRKVNTLYKQQTDSTRFFNCFPTRMFTDDNGLTTVVCTAYNRDYVENDTYVDNIAVTQLDDDGNELWGGILPLSQYLNSQRSYTRYSRALSSSQTVNHKNNFYIVYNDYDSNFDNYIIGKGDTVLNFNLTNACYYKLDNKKNITKHYLLGLPKKNEYASALMSSAAFDYNRGTYATLVHYKKGDEISLRMAWARLE